MTVYIHSAPFGLKEYTIRLIRSELRKNGVNVTEEAARADCVFCSVLDITEVSQITVAKNHGPPVVTGGIVSEYPLVNELSDYVYHGEIYELAEWLGRGGDVGDNEHITTKTRKRLRVNQRIEYGRNPIVEVGGRASYYYVGKGCPVMCKYCYIANARDYQCVPEALYRKAERAVPRGRAMFPIAAYDPYGAKAARSVTETLLRKYITGDERYKARTIRAGVEFCNPAYSKSLAKGVTIDHLNEALRRSSEDRSKMILYFIAGLESTEEWTDYFSRIAIDYRTTPAVFLTFTYLDAQPFTPFYDYDMRRRTEIDLRRIRMSALERNKRVRTSSLADMKKSTLRTMYGRCDNEEMYKDIKRFAGRRYGNADIIDHVEKNYRWAIGTATIEDVMKRPRKPTTTIRRYWDA